MSGSYQKPIDPYQALAQQITDLQAQVRDLQRVRPFVIPVLSADPPTTDPTNIWLFPDGRLRARHLNTAGSAFVTREWVPTTAGASTTGTAAATPVAPPVTRMMYASATYTQSYRKSGPARTDGGAINLYAGSSGDSFNGRNRSLIGFDYATIASTLSGAEVQACWLRMVNIHAWYNSGVEVFLGIHNFSAEPSSWAGGSIPRSMMTQIHWNKGEDKTVGIPILFAQSIRDGWGKGIALEAPSDSRSYYGYNAGVGSGYQIPQLIVQYAK